MLKVALAGRVILDEHSPPHAVQQAKKGGASTGSPQTSCLASCPGRLRCHQRRRRFPARNPEQIRVAYAKTLTALLAALRSSSEQPRQCRSSPAGYKASFARAASPQTSWPRTKNLHRLLVCFAYLMSHRIGARSGQNSRSEITIMVRCRKLPTRRSPTWSEGCQSSTTDAFQLALGHRLPPGLKTPGYGITPPTAAVVGGSLSSRTLQFAHLIARKTGSAKRPVVSASRSHSWRCGKRVTARSCERARAAWKLTRNRPSGHCLSFGCHQILLPSFRALKSLRDSNRNDSNLGVGSYKLRHMFFIADTQVKTVVFRIQKLRKVHSYQRTEIYSSWCRGL